MTIQTFINKLANDAGSQAPKVDWNIAGNTYVGRSIGSQVTISKSGALYNVRVQMLEQNSAITLKATKTEVAELLALINSREERDQTSPVLAQFLKHNKIR